MKNISVSNKNGKEVFIFKNLYCISGKDELFMQVSNELKNFKPLAPLQFAEELVLEPENVKPRKTTNDQDKKEYSKEKEMDLKLRVKNLKDKLHEKYQKIEVLAHTTNEDIEDSIIMQIISNFNVEKNNSKIKRPFDIIFNEKFTNIGVQLKGNKKMNGNIIFAI